MTPLAAADEAYHMVPARLNHGYMEACRQVMDRLGVSPNSAMNGEFLPKRFGTSALKGVTVIYYIKTVILLRSGASD